MMRKPNHQKDPARPLLLFLAQTRGLTAWSDGRRLVEGEELRALRAAALDRLISLRGRGADSDPDRSRDGNARAWRNYRALDRLRARSEPGVPLADRMARDLLTAAAGSDPGSAERRRLLRRALRRIAPERFGALPLRARCGAPELERVIAAGNRAGLVTRLDLIVDGVPVMAGTPVVLDAGGAARLTVPGLEHFPAGGLRLSDLKRDRPRTREAAGPDLDL